MRPTTTPACTVKNCIYCGPAANRYDLALEAAKKGKELLDRSMIAWRDKIDVDKLQLSADNRCVLGMVFGSYAKGFHEMFGYAGTGEQAGDHGFTSVYSKFSYVELDEAWRSLLRK